MSLLDGVAIPRRTMVLFFVIDTSSSMEGQKIGSVNSAIEEAVPMLKDISESNADAQIKVAVLEFSTGARWKTPSGPIEIDSFVWNDLDVGGVTDFGDACIQLNENLSAKKGFMVEASGSFAPAVFLLSDGDPTDNYKKGLEELKKNPWFKHAIKVALAIGDDADKSVLGEFTGNAETVLCAHTPAMLKKMIKFVSVRASEVASRSSNSSDETKQDAFTAELDQIKVEAAADAPSDGELW